jgi:hypothetical protein
VVGVLEASREHVTIRMTPPQSHHRKHLGARPLDFWLARSAILVIAALQIALVNDLSVGPRWLAPAIELALLAPLSVATAWTQSKARRAENDAQWSAVGQVYQRVRWLAIALTALATVMNFGQLARLIQAMLAGHAANGQTLLLDAVNIWLTNVVIFALWFWTIDRSGPAATGSDSECNSDFVFTQQQMKGGEFKGWMPGFIDYLFLAFTNATAFSPADTFPLTHRAKLLMMAESGMSLITIALVAARAVGILS